MKAAIYARVVTAGQPIELQLRDMRRMAGERGFELVAEYTDVGISGTKARRPGLDELMKSARKLELEVVLVASIDLVARSTKHFLQIMNELDGLGIRFLSLKQNIDTADAAGRQFLEALYQVAALEKSLSGERIKVAMRRAKSEGQQLGRARLNVDHAAIVRDRIAGLSLTTVAVKYCVSRASVVRFTREAQRREMGEVGGRTTGQQQKTTALECVA